MDSKICLGFHFDNDYERFENMGRIDQLPNLKAVMSKEQWSKAKLNNERQLKKWINDYLDDTSVTVLLIGSETSEASYVNRIIDESIKRGNGILGIRIHNVKDDNGSSCSKGTNPLDYHYVMVGDRHRKAANYYKTYTWSASKTQKHLENWVDEAKELANLR